MPTLAEARMDKYTDFCKATYCEQEDRRWIVVDQNDYGKSAICVDLNRLEIPQDGEQDLESST
jgi:hypothetical protein